MDLGLITSTDWSLIFVYTKICSLLQKGHKWTTNWIGGTVRLSLAPSLQLASWYVTIIRPCSLAAWCKSREWCIHYNKQDQGVYITYSTTRVFRNLVRTLRSGQNHYFCFDISSVDSDIRGCQEVYWGAENSMILTYKLKHDMDFNQELSARKIEEYAIKYRTFSSVTISTKIVRMTSTKQKTIALSVLAQ